MSATESKSGTQIHLLAVAEVHSLGLPARVDSSKNWDSLIALQAILECTSRSDLVLDAGGGSYSAVLPWLAHYGYRDLVSLNLATPIRRKFGPVRYEQGDLTKTRFADGSVGAVACLSVIEHGVEPNAYYREMARIIRPGGVLVTSTDYFPSHVDTGGQHAFGAPIRVFDRGDLVGWLARAERHGSMVVEDVADGDPEPCVTWGTYPFRYTFAVFTARRALGHTGP